MASRHMFTVIMAAAVVAAGTTTASFAQGKAATPLVPLRANDASPYLKELPGENMGDGGEFSVGRNRYVRLEGRHLTFRTATGVKACVVGAAAAKAWTFDTSGTIGCADVRLTIAVNNRVHSDDGQPVIVTVAQGGRTTKMAGLWQGLE